MSKTMTTAAAILKEMWPSNKLVTAGWQLTPFFSVIKKNPDLGGRTIKVPVEYASVQASAATFTSAQTGAAAGGSKQICFDMTTVRHYSLARVNGDVAAAARQEGPKAVVKVLDHEMRRAALTEARRCNQHLYRDRTGHVSGIATSGLSTTACTLDDVRKAHLFEVGMLVGATPDYATNARSGYATISAINRGTGVLTATANWTTAITSLADTDSLFIYGDYASANDKLCIAGLEAICPETAPTAGDSYFGNDRSVDVERLAGIRYDAYAAGDTLKEALVKGSSYMVANGMLKSGNYVLFLSPWRYSELANELDSNVTYTKVPAQGIGGQSVSISFDAIELCTLTGAKVKVIQDVDCPYDVAWCVDLEALSLGSMGAYPGVLGMDEDGQDWLRVYNADDYEVRMGGYPQLLCTDPGSICRINLSN
jgi:hypothetical protein